MSASATGWKSKQASLMHGSEIINIKMVAVVDDEVKVSTVPKVIQIEDAALSYDVRESPGAGSSS